MAERDSTKDGEFKAEAMGGLDQRTAPYLVANEDFSLLEGLYPKQSGMLARVPQKSALLYVPYPIRRIHQTNDGSGNIIVQTTEDLRTYTLDEIMGRESTPTPDLTPTPLPIPPGSLSEEEHMSMALIVHLQTNTTDGGALGATDNVFYARKLTTMVTNTDSTVSAFRAFGVANPNQFDLVTGVYRIQAQIGFSNTDGSLASISCTAGLYSVTDSRFEWHDGATVNPIIGTSALCADEGLNTRLRNGYVYIDGQFTVAGGTKTYSIYQAMDNSVAGGVVVAAATTALGKANVITAGTYNQIYATVKILKLS